MKFWENIFAEENLMVEICETRIAAEPVPYIGENPYVDFWRKKVKRGLLFEVEGPIHFNNEVIVDESEIEKFLASYEKITTDCPSDLIGKPITVIYGMENRVAGVVPRKC